MHYFWMVGIFSEILIFRIIPRKQLDRPDSTLFRPVFHRDLASRHQTICPHHRLFHRPLDSNLPPAHCILDPLPCSLVQDGGPSGYLGLQQGLPESADDLGPSLVFPRPVRLIKVPEHELSDRQHLRHRQKHQDVSHDRGASRWPRQLEVLCASGIEDYELARRELNAGQHAVSDEDRYSGSGQQHLQHGVHREHSVQQELQSGESVSAQRC